MIKFLRNLFGLCEHEWVHATNVMRPYGPVEGQVCRKCLRLRWREWR